MAERITIIDFVEKYVAKFSKYPFLWEKNLDTNIWESTTYEETLAKVTPVIIFRESRIYSEYFTELEKLIDESTIVATL